jgi:hypothetical protein
MRTTFCLAALALLAFTRCVGVTEFPAVNMPPAAVAGNEQTVMIGELVTLDGTQSTDPESDPLSYRWEQTGGALNVTLSSATAARPTFTAPSVASATTLVFRLTVSDGKNTSVASTAVTIQAPSSQNRPPVASVVAPPNAQAGSQVSLDGSGSTDPDGDSLTFKWTQTGGPTVALSSATAAQVQFAAPTVTADTALSFRLDINDGQGHSASANATVTIVPVSSNNPPVANAGSAQTVSAGAMVTLTGSATDPDGDALTYRWAQTAGPTVALNGATTATVKFTAPTVSVPTAFTFSLTATDSHGLSCTPSMVTITVNPMSTGTVNITKAVSLHAVTRSGIVIFFLTDTAVAASVQYGVAAISEHTFTETTPSTRHVIQLSGLTQDTTYQYQVYAGGTTATGTFKTAFDYATHPRAFTFAVVGDARAHTEWTKVATAVQAKAPCFVLQTGDNNDASGSATNWEEYYNVAKDLFANIPVFAAQGNHDTGSNYSVYNIAPQSSSGSDTYYAFVYGNAGFVALNTNSLSSAQTSWASGALSTLKGGPVFAYHHHPLYSCGSHGSSTSLQGTLQSMFETNTLTTDFTGHDHDLIFWSAVNNVRYVVSGGGGTSLYALSGCQGPYATSGYGFMMVNVNGAQVSETFYDDNGNQLYANPTFNAAGPSVPLSNLGNLVVY